MTAPKRVPKKLAAIIEADGPAAAAEFEKLDRGPGPDDAETIVHVQEEPALEPEED